MFMIEEDEKKREEQKERSLKLARFYKEEALYEEAIKKYELYIFLAKSCEKQIDYMIYKELAICYALKGHTAEAINNLRKAEDINASDESIIYLLAQMYLQAGVDEKAKQYYYKLLDLNGESVSVYYQLGEIYYRENDFAKAIECWEKVIYLEPTNSYTQYLLGVIYFTKKQYEKAEVAFKKAYEHGYRSAALYQYLGRVYSRLGNKEQSKLNFLIALEKDPSNALIYKEYLRELTEKELTEEKIKLESSEGYSISDYKMGLYYKYIGENEKALAVFKKLLKENISKILKVAVRAEVSDIYAMEKKNKS